MLALSLEKISQTPEGQYLDVRIFLDYGGNLADTEYVRDTYLPTAEIFQAKEHISVQSGCWNILNSLKAAYESQKDYIFFVEEDVFVVKSYFRLHWNIHNSGNYFVIPGRKLGRLPLDFYSNPGSSYRRKSLELIMPHINEEYFSDPSAYLDKHFPTMIGMDGVLDDGLIRKVQRASNGKVICTDPPTAYHVGFRYYGRLDPWVNRGNTIQERIEILREMLSKVDPKGRYSRDFEVFKDSV
jgi:hypothetical protein